MGARNAQEKDAADLSGVQRLTLKIALAIRGFLYFHTNLEIICSSSVKNTAGSLIGIALNL